MTVSHTVSLNVMSHPTSAGQVLASVRDVFTTGVPPAPSGTISNSGAFGINHTPDVPHAAYRHVLGASAYLTTRRFLSAGLYQTSGANDLETANNGGGFFILLEDSIGNWAAYAFWASGFGQEETEGQWRIFRLVRFELDLQHQSPQFQSASAPDLSDIVAWEFHCRNRIDEGCAALLVDLHLADFVNVTGNESFQSVANTNLAAESYGLPFAAAPALLNNAFAFYLDSKGLRIGDGVTTTTFAAAGFTVAPVMHGFDPATNDAAPWVILGDDRAFIINTSAACDIDLRQGAFVSDRDAVAFYTVIVSGSPAASVRFSATQFFGITRVELDHGTFDGCVFQALEAGLTVSSATNPSFSECVVRDHSAGVDALTITAGPGDYSAWDIRFRDNTSRDVVLGTGGAGTYDLSGLETASGYTLKIHNSSSTNAVTVILAAGVAHATTTAGGAVTVQSPPTTFTIACPNLLDGSRYQIVNVTAAQENINSVVAGGAGATTVLVSGVDYDPGDEIRIRATYVNGTTAKMEFERDLIAPTGTAINTVAGVQLDDDVYNALGIDGSSVVKFQADYVENDINLVVVSNFTVAEMYAWYAYNLTLENGIRFFFGGVTALDVGNFRINSDIVSARLDNTTTTALVQTDGARLFRSDGVRPVKLGGYGIDVNWLSPVLIAETGVSGLTGLESAQLAQAAADAAIAKDNAAEARDRATAAIGAALL